MYPFKTVRYRITTAAAALFLAMGVHVTAEQRFVSKSAARPLPERVTFNAHIRPLMSNTCFVCHGPDDKVNDSGFRIDSYDAATGPLPSDDERVGVKPGDPTRSEVYLRIMNESDGEQMPPENFRHQWTDYDKALLRKWIEQGAEYQEHWSYAPVRRPVVPEISRHADKVANPIDAFVLSRLEQQGVEPSDLAEKATLLRRLSLDLVGLPPTVGELKTFLSDESADAYQRQVERLLESEHFGERMASSWLDLVRFADTVGFHGDQNQRVFPYRDYVIDSFNNNKPFDQFTREQIAGDLLPNPTNESLTATGVLRLNMVTREGGAQPKEYLAKYKADRVRTLGTAWLGSTLGCCECHNHKYDPFTTHDFYSLGAFFDDLRQWGVYSDYGYTPNPDLKGFNNDYPFPPELRVDSPSLKAEIRHLQRERDEKLFQSIGDEVLASPDYEAWVERLGDHLREHPDGWIPVKIGEVSTSHETQHEVLEDGSLLLTGTGHAEETVTVTPQLPRPLVANSIRVEVLPDERHGGFVGRGDDGHFRLDVSAELKRRLGDSPRSVPNRPRYVRIILPGSGKILSLAEVQVFSADPEGELRNVAVDGKARQSSEYKTAAASLAIDGNTNGNYYEANSVTHTQTESDPWWEVDLGSERAVSKIAIWNRTDGDYLDRLNGFRIVLMNEKRQVLFDTTPDTPRPSTEINVPVEMELSETEPLELLWAEADRQNPSGYQSGQERLVLDGTWRSGPSRWQLPTDETKLPQTAVFHFARPIEIAADQQLIVRLKSGDIGRVRLSVTPIGHAIAGWPAASPTLAEAVDLAADERDDQSSAVLVSCFHRSTVPLADQHPHSRFYRDQILELRSGLAMTLVAQSIPPEELPISRVLPRGNWQDESGELAPPGFPHFLPQPSSDESQRRLSRLDLAAWLTSTDNPLTARHFVNRTWKQFFGTGLSGKLDDLGNQGEWPSHPLLMDWLAAEFVDSGWDVKHIIRLVVISRTYRQAAAVRTDLTEIDPYNRLLAQQSPRRLEAEIIRDNALSISGLLNTDYIGGPSVFPYQPAGHYANLQFPNRLYTPSRDSRQYRRGVYMHWQRTFLHPMLVNFDAPSRDECTADRSMSNSPQQALTLLNDPVFVEASHAMASQLLSADPDAEFSQLLSTAFLRAVAREPSERELESLEQLFREQREYYRNHPQDAEQLLAVGNTHAGTASSEDLAAWTQVCRVILNLHETITRY